MSVRTSNYILKNKLQSSGIVLSVLCGIHCAALPFILLLAPAMASGIANHFWMDALVLAIILVIGFLTIGVDYHKKHRDKGVLFVFILGLVLLILSHMTQMRWLEVFTAILGGALLASSQYYSLRLSRKIGAGA